MQKKHWLPDRNMKCMGLLNCCPSLDLYAWSRREMELSLCAEDEEAFPESRWLLITRVWAVLMDPGTFCSWLYFNPCSRGALEQCPIQKCLSLILGYFTDRQRMCYTKGVPYKGCLSLFMVLQWFWGKQESCRRAMKQSERDSACMSCLSIVAQMELGVSCYPPDLWITGISLPLLCQFSRLTIHSSMHKALGSCSGWGKWGNKGFLGFGWCFYLFLRSSCWTLSCSWKSAQTNKLKDENNSTDFPQGKQTTVPQVHHSVDWQLQTSRKNNHW